MTNEPDVLTEVSPTGDTPATDDPVPPTGDELRELVAKGLAAARELHDRARADLDRQRAARHTR
jgi:hypothetical protein